MVRCGSAWHPLPEGVCLARAPQPPRPHPCDDNAPTSPPPLTHRLIRQTVSFRESAFTVRFPCFFSTTPSLLSCAQAAVSGGNHSRPQSTTLLGRRTHEPGLGNGLERKYTMQSVPFRSRPFLTRHSRRGIPPLHGNDELSGSK